jgi:hypothetical protein
MIAAMSTSLHRQKMVTITFLVVFFLTVYIVVVKDKLSLQNGLDGANKFWT